MFYYANNYGISEPRRWTRQAAKCYKIGCDCSKCQVNDIMKNRCFMRKTVLVLVRKFGVPQGITFEGIQE